eukprot:CAMPEP_0204355756 /NCGR_PEP_ID=MMETSP0469-20131031/34409_1 /ASSEMBLY_ACC=CAM_ASM_000384 /TAXON_ID=2969 /ORGANISM="Oxyrrhis marina" /LENGTH=182 /DNA_ID=CAMNT_0051343081 /DNA_START=117 /DNA_END=666 /DNA_ORIENTATION=+
MPRSALQATVSPAPGVQARGAPAPQVASPRAHPQLDVMLRPEPPLVLALQPVLHLLLRRHDAAVFAGNGQVQAREAAGGQAQQAVGCAGGLAPPERGVVQVRDGSSIDISVGCSAVLFKQALPIVPAAHILRVQAGHAAPLGRELLRPTLQNPTGPIRRITAALVGVVGIVPAALTCHRLHK